MPCLPSRLAFLVFLHTPLALADAEPAGGHRAVVVFERLLLFSVEHTQAELPAYQRSSSRTTTRLDAPGDATGTPATRPQLGFHGWLALRRGWLSLGASGTYGSSTGNRPVEAAPTEPIPPDTSYSSVAPRVGVALPHDRYITIWLRGGLTYQRARREAFEQPTSLSTRTSSTLALSLDPMVVLSPTNGFGLMLGPVFDFPLRATSTLVTGARGASEEVDIHDKTFHFGAALGLAFWL